jgi:hypothetical protein
MKVKKYLNIKRLYKEMLNLKFLESIIRIILRILIVLTFFSILYVIIGFIDYSICFKINCFNKLLELLLEDKLLYSALIILITLVISIESFKEVKKNNKKEVWFKILKEELEYIKQFNIYIYRNTLLQTNKLYDFAYANNFEINNDSTLMKFFNEFLDASTVLKFEEYDINAKKHLYIYPNKDFTYSENSYLNIFVRIVQPTKEYANDFKSTFLSSYRGNLFDDKNFKYEINASKYKGFKDMLND